MTPKSRFTKGNVDKLNLINTENVKFPIKRIKQATHWEKILTSHIFNTRLAFRIHEFSNLNSENIIRIAQIFQRKYA